MLNVSQIVECYKEFTFKVKQKEAMAKDLEELKNFDDAQYVLEIVQCKNKTDAIRYLQRPHIWVSRVVKHTKGYFWFAEIKRK